LQLAPERQPNARNEPVYPENYPAPPVSSVSFMNLASEPWLVFVRESLSRKARKLWHFFLVVYLFCCKYDVGASQKFTLLSNEKPLS
jgi:hypothetical protein